MQKIYLDCDGVILDTITKSYRMLKEAGLTTEEEVASFYRNICWKKLIKESGEINDSLSKIKELAKHFDIEILTHVNSETEAQIKKEYFSKELPNINVITVPKQTKKADMVEAKNTVLVDDYLGNLDYWYEKGGIPIKFSSSGKECQYTSIEDLLELIKLFKEEKIEVKE